MLDQNFCEFLENKITQALGNSEDKRLKGFWCDGIVLLDSENDYSKKDVNNKRQIVMTAFLGHTGQDKYRLTLRFGQKASSKYARDLSLEECVPNLEDNNWLDIDTVNKKIVIQLD